MLVEQVGLEAAEAVGVVHLDADIKMNRRDGGAFADEKLLCATEDGVALFQIEFRGGVADELVVRGIAPTGAVVAGAGEEEIEKRVRVVVVADPA